MIPLLARALGVLLLAGLLVVIYRKFSFRKRCPACGYAEPNRVPRKGMAKTLPLKAYVCPRCRNHFYKLQPFTEIAYEQNSLD
ncbi:hypothetical protein WBJ53_17945 [Spirosoma sp. SC4-14]|uniref:hypothetical protein n=1 Tax=Spirosoma sp. SC4-14 TaxID=3128900 RepID=UPI0030CE0ABE